MQLTNPSLAPCLIPVLIALLHLWAFWCLGCSWQQLCLAEPLHARHLNASLAQWAAKSHEADLC